MRVAIVALCLAGCAMPPPGILPLDPETSAEIARYVKALESKNASVCLDAVDYLPYFGAIAVPTLIEELRSVSSNGRAFAAATLGRIGDARAVGRLIELLDDGASAEFMVLSDDGTEMHPAYDNPALPVKEQARAAIAAITGRRFPSRVEAEKWWSENGDPLASRVVERTEAQLPPHARWLKGWRIVLDAGHGGDMHKRGYKRGPTYASEAEANLRVARFLRDLLVRAGATVVMTRESDRDVDLKARPQMAAGCDLFLSIHHNWSPNLGAQATTTWYHAGGDKPASLDMARYIQEETIAAVAPADVPRAGGLMDDTLMYKSGFAVLRELPEDVAGCLVETTYYSNLAMERRMRDIEFNRLAAMGMLMGLAKYAYYGVPRAEVAAAGAESLELRVFDGLEDRGEWAKPHRILADFVIVRIDGARVTHAYDAERGRITVKGSFTAGEHVAVVDLINVHKNHSWPRPLRFTVR